MVTTIDLTITANFRIASGQVAVIAVAITGSEPHIMVVGENWQQ
jgi:hypothetical protein